MKATFLLRRDHAVLLSTLTALLDRWHDGTAGTAVKQQFQEIRTMLEVHMRLEEEIFYPACESVPELREPARRAREEHRTLKQLLREVGDSPFDFDARAHCRQLAEQLERHVEEEEEDIFPQARRALGDGRIEALGRELAERRDALQPQPA